LYIAKEVVFQKDFFMGGYCTKLCSYGELATAHVYFSIVFSQLVNREGGFEDVDG
jgi:hypothetical protein